MKEKFDNYFNNLYVVLIFSFIFLVWLTWGVLNGNTVILYLDKYFSGIVLLFRNLELTYFFKFITFFGEWQLILSLVLLSSTILFFKKRPLYIMPIFVTVLGSGISSQIIKIVTHRPRPEISLYTESTFSFPSGHATLSLAFYGFVLYVLMREIKREKVRINLLLTGLIIIFLIGFSRLYIGLHYMSDVVGGYLVGGLWLIIGILISEWIFSKKTLN